MAWKQWDFWWWHSFDNVQPREWHKHRLHIWVPPGTSLDDQWDMYMFSVWMEKRRWWRAVLAGVHPLD
jgi:hypothetical protein